MKRILCWIGGHCWQATGRPRFADMRRPVECQRCGLRDYLFRDGKRWVP